MDNQSFEDAQGVQRDLRLRIASSIRQMRASRGLTQEALSHRSGLALRHLQKIEAAEVNVTLHSLARIAEALGIDTCELLTAKGPGAGS